VRKAENAAITLNLNGVDSVEEQLKETDQTVLTLTVTITKALTKTTNCTSSYRAKKSGGAR